MAQDAYGLELTTSSDDAAAAWDRAVAASLEHRLIASKHVKAALEHDPDFVMALCFRGAMILMIGSNQVHGKAGEAAARARQLASNATRREQMHVSGLEHWLAGNNKKACAVWQEILDQWPADMLALRFHHHGSFWSGDRKGLLSAPHGAPHFQLAISSENLWSYPQSFISVLRVRSKA